jgi:hypothetical protein
MMGIITLLGMLSIIAVSSFSATAADIPSEVTPFKNVNVFDVKSEKLLKGYDVLVVKNKIREIRHGIPTSRTYEIDVKTEVSRKPSYLHGRHSEEDAGLLRTCVEFCCRGQSAKRSSDPESRVFGRCYPGCAGKYDIGFTQQKDQLDIYSLQRDSRPDRARACAEVITCNGRDGFLNALRGSRSERVLSKTHCPLLSMPVASLLG